MRHLRLSLAAGLLLVSLPLLAWGAWPVPHEREELVFLPAQMGIATPTLSPISPLLGSSVPAGATPSAGSQDSATQVPKLGPVASKTAQSPQSTSVPAEIPELRRVVLEYPLRIRSGDSDVIRLTFAADNLAALGTAPAPSETVPEGQSPQPADLYATYNVVAEAELDLAGMNVRPPGPVSEPLLPGESAGFNWIVRPAEPATYQGTVWLFLVFVDRQTQNQTRLALSAQSIRIEAANLAGLSGSTSRVAGGLGTMIGAILGFPFCNELTRRLLHRVRIRR